MYELLQSTIEYTSLMTLTAVSERTKPAMKDLWQVLLHMSEGAKGELLSCEECFMFLDCLSDLLADGYPVKEIMPLAGKYMNRCPECEQEHLHALIEFYTGREAERRLSSNKASPAPPRALHARSAGPTGRAAHGGK
jgi:hypothetical protein